MPRCLPFNIPAMQAMDKVMMHRAVLAVKALWPTAKPKFGVVLGSGWGEAIEGFSVKASIPYTDIAGFGKTGVPGHAGRLLHATLDGTEVFIFQGRRHVYEGEGWTPVILPVWLLKQFDAKGVLITNASGGIRSDLRPGTLMVIEDHINLLGGNPLIGPHYPEFGERFPDQTAVYRPELRQALLAAGAEASGVYLATPGPTFETPAEIRAFRALGADAVGMSTVPEAIFANALGLAVAGLSCISNPAAGLGAERLTDEDILHTAHEALPRMRQVIQTFIRNVTR